MTTLAVIGAALLFFALIMASIALHEVGHLVPAKLFGVKAIPLGGYVRLIGMYPPARTPAPGRRPGRLGEWADAAREVEYESITPADDGRLFHQKKTWQKLIVMAGGPAMNLLLAFVIVGGVNALHGQYRPQLAVERVSECMIAQGRADQTCRAGDPATPARLMGIRAGDVIVSFNGQPISRWDQFSDLIRANRDRPATVVVQRDGHRVSLPTRPTVVTGVPDKLNPGRTLEAGFLGVTPRYALVRSGPVGTGRDLWLMTKQSAVGLAQFPVKVWNVASDLVRGRPRDVNGPMSIVGASRAAGEIATTDRAPLGDRISGWFLMLGSVNLFVALLNLVPLPPLDGGHMAGALYEGARRGWARLRGRPDPGHVDTARMLPVSYAVGGFLLVAGLVLVIADVVSPVRLF